MPGTRLINQKLHFSLYSSKAKKVHLHLFQHDQEIKTLPMEKEKENTFHIEITDFSPDMTYYYSIDGKNAIDPYALELNTTNAWGFFPKNLRSSLTFDHSFSWDNVSSPELPFHQVIIYELLTRSFTKHPSSKTKYRGTYLGIIEKIPYLKSLGITAIELMPIHEFCERENPHINPCTKKPLFNVWGYNTINFFAPMKRFAYHSHRLSAIEELKLLVKECHKAKIEIYLDVVYNHVSSLSGLDVIDKSSYFILDAMGHHTNYTGCGNTIAANHPMTIDLILSSLRYFAKEFHIDGFRLDLASSLTRGQKGEPLQNPPLFSAIGKDPLLQKKKWIVEPWDPGGLYQLGSFPMKEAYEWNDFYQKSVRRYLHMEHGGYQDAKKAISGSFSKKKHMINYVVAHDGFCLHDLVSYQQKHNKANGENNRDGSDVNFSSNGGFEGPTKDPNVLSYRLKQMKNFFALLLMSPAPAMFYMGDEFAHTKKGNNNSYPQDNDINDLNWNRLKEYQELFKDVTSLIALRKELSNSGPFSIHIEDHPDNRCKIMISDKIILYMNASPNLWSFEDHDLHNIRFTSAELINIQEAQYTLAPFSSMIGEKKHG